MPTASLPASQSSSADSPPWSVETAALLSTLRTRSGGLTPTEAASRLASAGPNTLKKDSGRKGLRIFLAQFRSPLVLILVAASAIALSVGEIDEGLIILVIVLASSLLSFWQEYAASQAMDRLLERLEYRVAALRDGQQVTIPAEDVVPGDILMLSAGVLVAADAIVLEATDLDVAQAALTGEPFPVAKEPGRSAPDATLLERTNMVFAGTSVRSGMGKVLVVATGAQTAFAGIAKALRGKEPETEFMRGVRRFGVMITEVVLVLVIVIFAANLLLHRPLIDSLLFSLALAVGLTPELLPAIISVTLSHGARLMEQQGVIVRRLHSIENLGSMDMLCTDKTGTLTEGAIRLEAAKDATGADSAAVLRWAALNATLQSGIENPLDEAIRMAPSVKDLNFAGLLKLDEIPYDFARKRLSVIVRETDTQARLICKGALQTILDVCVSTRMGDAVTPLTEDDRQRIDALHRQWSAEGYRVLGVAVGDVAPHEHYGREAEADLTFAGFLLFQDSPKEGVEQALAKLAACGVRVKIITGDNRYAAAHLAKEVGLPAKRILTGAEMAKLPNEALFGRAERTDIFAEIDPSQKERVITALRRRGHVVGYLGDGINDAPALHAADVGISVDSAVDVAREAADIVLLQKSLTVLLDGIAEGRRTFANTMKYIAITTSANFGNMISMAAASLFLPFLPMLAKQILLNNFLSDLPSLAIATDRVDPEVAARPHGWDIGYIRRFMVSFGGISSLFDFITFAFLLFAVGATEPVFQTAWFVLSLVTELGILFVARTRRPAWMSRPGSLLIWCSIAVAIVAFALPWMPFAGWMGFVPLPANVLIGLVAIALGYFIASEALKRWLFPQNKKTELHHGSPHARRDRG